MEKLRQLAPWQIIAIAVTVLLVFMAAAYFVVTRLTTSHVKTEVVPTIAGDLNSESNKNILKLLDKFETPKNLPIQTQPLRTPDPNKPSTVNPFSG